MGCCPVELHGPANVVHNERCHGGGYHRASVSCQFWATDGSLSLDIWLYEPIAEDGGRPHEPQMAYCWQFVCMVGRHLSDGNRRHL